MFVGLRPSASRAREEDIEKDKPLNMFYEVSKEEGLGNAHLTDFIKTKAKIDKNPWKLSLI